MMAWIRIPDWTSPKLRDLYEQHKEPSGRMDAILAIHGLHPQGLVGHVALYKEVMFGRGPLSRRDRELIGTVVSAANRCRY